MDITLFIGFCIIWSVIYITLVKVFGSVAYFGLTDRFAVDKQGAITTKLLRPKFGAASRGMGIVHSSIIVPMAIYSLYVAYPQWDYTSVNTSFQQHIFEFGLSYFAIDFVHFALYEPDDMLLLVHHIVSVTYFLSVWWLGFAGLALCVALVTGEITNPLQSMWYLSKAAGNTRLYQRLSPWFTASFVFVRAIVLPIWCKDIAIEFYSTPKLSGISRVIWLASVTIMTLGSWVWCYQLTVGYFKYKSKARKGTRTPSTTNGDGETADTNGTKSHSS